MVWLVAGPPALRRLPRPALLLPETAAPKGAMRAWSGVARFSVGDLVVLIMIVL